MLAYKKQRVPLKYILVTSVTIGFVFTLLYFWLSMPWEATFILLIWPTCTPWIREIGLMTLKPMLYSGLFRARPAKPAVLKPTPANRSIGMQPPSHIAKLPELPQGHEGENRRGGKILLLPFFGRKLNFLKQITGRSFFADVVISVQSTVWVTWPFTQNGQSLDYGYYVAHLPIHLIILQYFSLLLQIHYSN